MHRRWTRRRPPPSLRTGSQNPRLGRVWLIADDYGRLANRIVRRINLESLARDFQCHVQDACPVWPELFHAAFDAGQAGWSDSETAWMLRCAWRPHDFAQEHPLTKQARRPSRVIFAVGHRPTKSSRQRAFFRDLATQHAEQPVALIGLHFDGSVEVDPLLVKRYRAAFAQLASTKGQAKSVRDLVVGVHFRQGDYRTWLGGKYYRPFSRYCQTIEEIRLQQPDRSILAKICTDGPAPQCPTMQGVKFELCNGTETEDLLTLSQCDMIVGTYSSYAYLAAFSGDVPIVDVSMKGESLRFHRVLFPRLSATRETGPLTEPIVSSTPS